MPDLFAKVFRSAGVGQLRRILRTMMVKLIGGADYERWSKDSELSPDWDTRTQLIASQIAPGASVIEFGAGRMILRKYLPAGCRYSPSDLVSRGQGTIICDLNGRQLPKFPRHDVAVFSGVLEYVNDVPRLISHLAGCVDVVIASYAVLENNEHSRRAKGWVNDFTSAKFVELFAIAGFREERRVPWRTQQIIKFTKL